MKRILVATDFSERSDRAVQRASRLARRLDARLILIHVVDDDQLARLVESGRRAASEVLEGEAETLAHEHGLSCETQVILDAPFAGIATAVEQRLPDLLIIGAHRRQALRDIFVGTAAERTLRSVHCPVLMANAPAAADYDHVLLATDLSEESRQALSRYLDLDPAPAAQVSLLHVFDAPEMRLVMSHVMRDEGKAEYIEELRREAARRLADFARSLSGIDTNVMQRMVRQRESGTPGEILAAARDHSADLLVVGTRGRTGMAKLLLGSVAEALLRDADRDVLAVPCGGPDSPEAAGPSCS